MLAWISDLGKFLIALLLHKHVEFLSQMFHNQAVMYGRSAIHELGNYARVILRNNL